MKFIKVIYILTLASALVSFFVFVTNPPEYLIDGKQVHEQLQIEKREKEAECIRQALWYEARGETKDGMLAVASVIYNRKNSQQYPDTYCEVIHQPKQFSYVHERSNQGLSLSISPKSTEEEKIYEEIDSIAKNIVKDEFEPTLPKGTMWYHATYVKPRWSKVKERVAKIKGHIFYKRKENRDKLQRA